MESHNGFQRIVSASNGRAKKRTSTEASRRCRGRKHGTPVFTPNGELAGWWMPGNHGNSYLLHVSGRR